MGMWGLRYFIPPPPPPLNSLDKLLIYPAIKHCWHDLVNIKLEKEVQLSNVLSFQPKQGSQKERRAHTGVCVCGGVVFSEKSSHFKFSGALEAQLSFAFF